MKPKNLEELREQIAKLLVQWDFFVSGNTANAAWNEASKGQKEVYLDKATTILSQFQPLIDLLERTRDTCPECYGSGKFYNGDFSREGGFNDGDCPVCDGSGRTGDFNWDRLAVLAPDQRLPEIPEFQYDDEEYIPYLQRGAINYSKLLKNNWVKVVK